MCTTAYYVHPGCHCRWLRITRRCAPGLGFSTCPVLLDQAAQLAPPAYRARLPGWYRVKTDFTDTVHPAPASSICPKHGLYGFYDRNDIRLILDIQKGIRWGTGPNREDCGVEYNCSIM